MRKERICRDGTNPLEIYDDLELIERFRFDRLTSANNSTAKGWFRKFNIPQQSNIPAV